MFLLVFVALISVSVAVPPIWWNGGQCGLSMYHRSGEIFHRTGKIVGGQEARPFEFPWQVSLRDQSSGQHLCGGSIINERWIVTAAHCVEGEDESSYSVVVGEHSQRATSTFRQIHQIYRIFVHENYHPGNKEWFNDIAVIKTMFDILFNDNVRPICAPDPDNPFVSGMSLASGWGKLAAFGPSPDTLQYVILNIIPNEYCNSRIDINRPDVICARGDPRMNHQGTCEGDSGGPLSVEDSTGKFTLVGVTSFGGEICGLGPTVFSRVSFQTAWITDMIANN